MKSDNTTVRIGLCRLSEHLGAETCSPRPTPPRAHLFSSLRSAGSLVEILVVRPKAFGLAVAAWILLLGLGRFSAVASGPLVQQSFQLVPGWNAIWLEVQPETNRADAVFAGLPVASVWTRSERASAVDFIQDPSEEAFNQAGWLGWFPLSRPESFLRNLFTVGANRAYLIKLTNSVPIGWTLAGRASLRTPEWVPDAYHLTGLPVDPASPPTFRDFFKPSKAHYDTATGQLRKAYWLRTGQWMPVVPGDVVVSGEAYWIYTQGASDYGGPLKVNVDLGDGLDYGVDLTELNLRLANRTTSAMTVTVRESALSGAPALAYYQFSTGVGGQWPALPSPLALVVGPGSETRLRMAVRRQAMSSLSYASVLEIRDGTGTRIVVPVSAEVSATAPGPGSRAGLWVGSATLDAVSEPHSANPTTPTPVKSPMSLRLVIHVDASGQARLLREVLQMWREGTYTNDDRGDRVVEKPGQYVLLTEDTLIPFFQGSGVRDGEPVGRRLSTIGYDFQSVSNGNTLNLSGSFGVGQTLIGTLTLPFDHSRNPFKHKFHPDHDNLNVRFNGPEAEAFTTTRQIELSFAASPPTGPAVPDFGHNEMGGTYRETLSGIHKNAIHIGGTFRLSRVSLIAELNPNPTP